MKLDYDEIEVGDFLSETQYYMVVSKKAKEIKVVNERGFEFGIEREIVEEGMCSAQQFQDEVQVSRTDLGEILRNTGDKVFTVNFNKKINPKDLEDKIFEGVRRTGGQFESYEVLQKKVKDAIKRHFKGEERTLIGYLCRTEVTPTGYSMVIDLEQPLDGNRVRQVDHRTVNWLILNGLKYVVKK